MIKLMICVILLGISSFGEATPLPKKIQTVTDQWDQLVGRLVDDNGGVDYLGFSKDRGQLKSFIDAHQSFNVGKLDDKSKKAIYINLYNATMIENILRYCSDKKIALTHKDFLSLEINGLSVPGGNIWSGDYKVNLSGQMVNLDDIEHNLIRGQGGGKLKELMVSELDPRIHAAVNCAALSCPRVLNVAYYPDSQEKRLGAKKSASGRNLRGDLPTLLENNMKEWLSSNDHFLKATSKRLRANSIVYWYYSDFDDYGQKNKLGGAGGYLAQFVGKTTEQKWKVDHLKKEFNDRSKFSLKLSSAFSFHYDWRINDQRNKKPVAANGL